MGLVQIFSDKAVTTPKGTTLVAYPVCAIILNVFLRKGQCIIDNIHAIVRLSSVCYSVYELQKEESNESDDISVYGCTSFTTVRTERGVPVIEDLERGENQIRVPHEDIKIVVRRL